MPYLIDGHNLIGQLPDIRLDDPDDEAKLIVKLRSFCARTSKTCHVVFDRGLPGGKSRMSNNVVQVAFAPHPGEADEVMLARIRKVKDVKGWFVVSSDERVLRAAQQRGMKVVRSAEFAQQMNYQPPRIPKEESPHLFLTKKEVDEWMALFNGDESAAD